MISFEYNLKKNVQNTKISRIQQLPEKHLEAISSTRQVTEGMLYFVFRTEFLMSH
jgi:hypothetical protein